MVLGSNRLQLLFRALVIERLQRHAARPCPCSRSNEGVSNMHAALSHLGNGNTATRSVRDDLRVLHRAICEIRVAIDASREIINESLRLVRHPLFDKETTSGAEATPYLPALRSPSEGEKRRAGARY